MEPRRPIRLDRRQFFSWTTKRGLALGVAGLSAGSLLSACAAGVEESTGGSPSPDASPEAAKAIVGDVVEFELTSSDWAGAFGFVTFKLHAAVYDGEELYFIRTDASDEKYASDEGLVYVPRMATLTGDLAGDAYFVTNGTDEQAVVLSTQPGRDNYTPAWRIHRVSFNGTAETLTSVADITDAGDDVKVVGTGAVANMPVVKWKGGELPVDSELDAYLGGGQLISAPDGEKMRVTFKLHECYPGSRYIVTDTAGAPMAEGMKVFHSPALAGATDAQATGRTNVFMGGIEGPGPMGFQPSVFDSRAGDPKWSPYWDHMTYVWDEAAEAKVLATETEVHAATDDGDLEEFVGTPDTGGAGFVVNCPVPVTAPNTFKAP